jgi:hypothetical protein
MSSGGWANVITYDTIGNPESYYNGFYFTWEDGRRLAFASVGMDSYSFTYNDEGIRTSKTYNNSVTHKYTLDGSRIISEQWGNHFIAYLYDESGAPIGMQYRYCQEIIPPNGRFLPFFYFLPFCSCKKKIVMI